MSRCLITGASGFVGSNLARRLTREGWDVRCLVRGTSRLDQIESLGAELVQGSLDDPESLKRAAAGVDAVFHLAGRTIAFRASDYMRDNAEGTRRLAEACEAAEQPPVFVMVSSLAAGGPGTPKAPRREEQAEKPVSAYGRSKLGAERALAVLAGKMPISIVRPPMVFGQADRASLQMFLQFKRLPVHPSPGFRRFPVSLIHVTDLCDAIVRIADRGERLPAGGDGAAAIGVGKYYAAAERHVTYGQFGQLAARAAGWRIMPLPLPKPIFWFAASLGEAVGRLRKRPAIVNIDKVREATAKGWICSDEKIRAALGYKPGATLEERFAETVAWYREYKWI
jgi:nucleoside-diphosphate-sugar epimerase